MFCQLCVSSVTWPTINHPLRLPTEVIVRSKAAPLFVVLTVAFVYVSLFSHRIPVPIQSILFFVVLLLEIAMIAAGWWYCIKNRKAGVPNWRRRMALLGTIANTIAFSIPVGSLVYMIFYSAIARYTHTPMVDAQEMILACLVFSFCGVIAGVLSPAGSRFATTTGSLIIALLVLAIPMAVL